MGDQEFLLKEYDSLKSEIKEAKSRRYKTIIYGLSFIPAGNYFMDRYVIDTLSLTLPLQVIILAMVFTSDNNTIMRCGRYIRENIEPNFKVNGWEHWLINHNMQIFLSIEKFITISLYFMFLIYYIISISLASNFLALHYANHITIMMMSLYLILGLTFFTLLYRNIKISTLQ